MAVLLRNRLDSWYLLPPFQYGGRMLAPGTGVVIQDSLESVQAAVGPIGSALEFSTVPDGQVGAIFPSSGMPQYEELARPDPATVAPGLCIYNITTGIPNYSDGASWRNAAGVIV